MVMPRIMHEYILLWKKRSTATIHLLGIIATEQAARLRGTWRSIIRNVMMTLGGTSNLEKLYEKIAAGCVDRISTNPNWKAKVRQILNSTGDYRSVERGVWAIAN
jgi:hypothetical protein